MKQLALFSRLLAVATALLLPFSTSAADLPPGYPSAFHTIATLDKFGESGNTLILGDSLVYYYEDTVVHTLRNNKVDIEDLRPGTRLGFRPIVSVDKDKIYTSIIEVWELPDDYIQLTGDE